MSEEQAPPKDNRDVALLCGRTEDGDGYRILRAREGQLEAGEVRPLREGKPLHGGEVVTLSPRKKAPWLCDVKTACELPAAKSAPSAGPAQVATEAYRRNWERIFSSDREKDDKTLN